MMMNLPEFMLLLLLAIQGKERIIFLFVINSLRRSEEANMETSFATFNFKSYEDMICFNCQKM